MFGGIFGNLPPPPVYNETADPPRDYDPEWPVSLDGSKEKPSARARAAAAAFDARLLRFLSATPYAAVNTQGCGRRRGMHMCMFAPPPNVPITKPGRGRRSQYTHAPAAAACEAWKIPNGYRTVNEFCRAMQKMPME